MKFNKFHIGITLITISFIVSVLDFYLLILSIPIYCIGCIFVIISPKKIGYKILSILLPLALYLPANSLSLEMYKYLKRKEFLVPVHYSGPLRIIYEENCGEKLNDQDKTYQFPQDGILILSATEDGGLNHHYFYIGKNGKKIEIPEVDPITSQEPIPNISLIQYGEKNGIKYLDLYCNTRDVIPYHFGGSHPKFDSLTVAKVNECRKK